MSLAQTSPWIGEGDRGDRGPPLLPARRHRLPGHRPGGRQRHQGGRTVEGGSTITQQLVRNLYIGPRPDAPAQDRRGVSGDAAVAPTARTRGSSTSTSTRSTTATTHMGSRRPRKPTSSRHARGADACCRRRCSRGCRRRRWATTRSTRRAKALARRNEVLEGAAHAEARSARGTTPRAIAATGLEAEARAPLPDAPTAGLLPLRDRRAAAPVRAEHRPPGGLKVYTTIDPRLAARRRTHAINGKLTERTDPASALVAIDPRNGAIKTMTGGDAREHREPVQPRRAGAAPGWLDVQDLRSRAGRLPGHQPRHDELRVRTALLPALPEPGPVGGLHVLHSYLGSTSITHATLASDNTVYARLTLDLGAEKVAAMANRLGVANFAGEPKVGAYVPRSGSRDRRSRRSTWPAPMRRSPPAAIHSKPMAIKGRVWPDGKVDEDRAGASRSASE